MAQGAQIRKIFFVIAFGRTAITADKFFSGPPFRPDTEYIPGVVHDQAEGQPPVVIEGPVKIEYKPPDIPEVYSGKPGGKPGGSKRRRILQEAYIINGN
jgi:hypothetical protein